MKTFSFRQEQWLPQPIHVVFPFFADARNLQRLTPEWLEFTIMNPEVEMRQGARIDYRLRIRGLPVRWQSEISSWQPPRRFADRQLRGPYRMWVHEHTFTEKQGGTLVEDSIAYAVYGGRLIERLLVGPDLRRIFEYRRNQLEVIFGK